MKIDSYDNTHFGATKILSAKTVEKGCETITDVYKLNAEDIPFIRRCLDVCQGKDRFISDNDMNIYTGETPKEALKDFFKAFIKQKNGNFYIAVKNNSIISGILRTVSSGWEKSYWDRFGIYKKIDINKKLVLDNNIITGTVLDDTVIREMKKEIKSISHPSELVNDIMVDSCLLEAKVAGRDIKYEATRTLKLTGGKYHGYTTKYDTNYSREFQVLKKLTPNTTYTSTYEDLKEYNLAKILEVD